MTSFPTTANFTSLTLYNNSVATTTYVDGVVSSSAKQLLDAIGLSLTKKSVCANFLSLKGNNTFVASQTYVDNAMVATYSQAVTNTNSALTNKTMNRNFLTLKKINDASVATQTWESSQSYLRADPRTALRFFLLCVCLGKILIS